MAGQKQIPEAARERVKVRLRSGASIDNAHAWALKERIQVSRGTIAIWRREVEAVRAATRTAAPLESETAAPLEPQLDVLLKLHAEVVRLRVLVEGGIPATLPALCATDPRAA